MLGELVRALLPEHPELEVHTDVTSMLEVAQGATLVLAPRAEDAAWLNINRPVFSYRELRVILWCDAETTLALAQQAVDFVDWISHRVECPSEPPRYAVAGIRCALADRVPGIVWLGGDLEACFAAARPRGRLHRISAAQPYAELVKEVKAHRRQWLAWADIDDASRLRRVRWALAEARHQTRVFMIEPAVPSPGWRRIHARAGELRSARETLARAGARYPGRLAALIDLEPEAIELLAQLLQQGERDQPIETELLGATDPGALVARLVSQREAAPEQALTREQAPIPLVRGMGERLLPLRKEELGNISRQLDEDRHVGTENVAWWAAWSRTPASTEQVLRLAPVIRGFVAEPLLRSRQRTGGFWRLLGRLALDAGEADVARHWSEQALEASQSHEADHALSLHILALASKAQGRYSEAEALLRRSLSIDEKALGGEHPDYGASLHALAGVLSS
ncbi:MAG: tetratricopeptide repeat protein, partial [Myxococcaceae bacterium]|nr:tetratricopeptide repeat protein [Myxococcaceae bacterium]